MSDREVLDSVGQNITVEALGIEASTKASFLEIADKIATIYQSPGWETFVGIMQAKVAAKAMEAVMDAPANVLLHRGWINGVNTTLQLVESMVKVAENIRKEDEDEAAPRKLDYFSPTGLDE